MLTELLRQVEVLWILNLQKSFLDFAKTHRVFLVTGSDKPKTLEQVGEEIYNACMRVFNCSGNDVYYGSNQLYKNKWTLPEGPHEWLAIELTESKYPKRTGLHFEHRTGMCNFSVVGRNATMGERKMYVEYDTKSKERIRIAEQFQKFFPAIQAVVGGETGIDIFPYGKDKAQIVK